MIRYRYPNGEWQNVDGDRYELITSTQNSNTGCCFNLCAVRVTWDEVDRNTLEHQYSKSEGKAIGYRVLANPNKPMFFEGSRSSDSGNGAGTASSMLLNLIDRDGVLSSIRFFRGNFPGATFFTEILESSVKVTFSDADSNNPPCGTCVIKVYKNDNLIHENTNNVCPEVEEIQSNICPENTCEVICGDTICCYDSNGIAVESFPVN